MIDAHTHITPDGKWIFPNFDSSLERLKEEIIKSNAEKVIILPIYPFIKNDFIFKICRENKELIGFGSLDIRNPEPGIQEIKKFNLKGLKLHPRLQKFDVADKKITEIIKKCNLPVLIDALCNEENNYMLKIGKLAEQLPEIKFIVAHSGGEKVLDSFKIAEQKNIFFDLSFSLFYFQNKPEIEHFKKLIKKYPSKCIFGSDFPEVGILQAKNIFLKVAEEINLNKEQIEAILSNNIKRVLNIQ